MFSLSQVIKIQQQKEEEEEEKKEDEEKKKKKKKRRRERRDRRRQKKKNNKKMNEGNTLPKTYTNTAQTKREKITARSGARYDGGGDGGGRSRLFYNRKNNIY